MADIFISYARADRDRIEKLAAALEAEGYSVWWDRHIAGGSEFSKDIQRELDRSKAVIVAWSKDSVESRWVKDEAGLAAEAGKLVCITIDGEAPPIGFKQFHAIEFSNGDAGAFDDLKRSLAMKVTAPERPAGATAPPAAAPMKLSDPKILGGGLAVLALVLVAAFMITRNGADGIAETQASVAASDEVQEKSIAVLPFRDLSPGGDQQWFSDGLAEEITTTIARAPDIYVSPAAESFSFRDSAARATEIAKNLNVAHILSGSVRRSDLQMRVTVELIRAGDGEQIWTQSYDRQTTDAIAVQEDIALEVAKRLETALDPEALAEMLKAGTNSIEAYEAYLRAGAIESASGRDWVQRQLDQYARAIEIDPGFIAPRLATVSGLQYRMSFNTYGWAGPEQALEDAQSFNRQIDEILALVADRKDKHSADIAEETLAYRDIYELRFASAAKRYDKLIRENPKNPGYWYGLVMNATAIGDYETARRGLRQYVDLTNADSGWALARYRLLGIPEEGREYALKTIDNRADSFVLYRAGELLALLGDVDGAREALQILRDRDYFERNQNLIRIKIACAEGRYDVLQEIVASESRGSSLARRYLGEKIPKPDSVIALERSEPPYFLIGWGYGPDFDTTDLPITRAVLDRAGLPHDQPSLDRQECAPEQEKAGD